MNLITTQVFAGPVLTGIEFDILGLFILLSMTIWGVFLLYTGIRNLLVKSVSEKERGSLSLSRIFFGIILILPILLILTLVSMKKFVIFL